MDKIVISEDNLLMFEVDIKELIGKTGCLIVFHEYRIKNSLSKVQVKKELGFSLTTLKKIQDSKKFNSNDTYERFYQYLKIVDDFTNDDIEELSLLVSKCFNALNLGKFNYFFDYKEKINNLSSKFKNTTINPFFKIFDFFTKTATKKESKKFLDILEQTIDLYPKKMQFIVKMSQLKALCILGNKVKAYDMIFDFNKENLFNSSWEIISLINLANSMNYLNDSCSEIIYLNHIVNLCDYRHKTLLIYIRLRIVALFLNKGNLYEAHNILKNIAFNKCLYGGVETIKSIFDLGFQYITKRLSNLSESFNDISEEDLINDVKYLSKLIVIDLKDVNDATDYLIKLLEFICNYEYSFLKNVVNLINNSEDTSMPTLKNIFKDITLFFNIILEFFNDFIYLSR